MLLQFFMQKEETMYSISVAMLLTKITWKWPRACWMNSFSWISYRPLRNSKEPRCRVEPSL